MTTTSRSVAIVGGGPVGLVAAIDLARHGLRPIVLEAKDEITWSSRAICIGRRSFEILDRIGAGAAFAAKGLPWSRGRSFHRDRLVFRLEMPYAQDDRHAPFINIQQFYTEQFLVDALERLRGEGAEIRWGHRLAGLREEAEGVVLDVASEEGAYELEADWVVAADGGRSTVRELLGLSLAGTSYEGRYLIADIEVAGVARPVERLVWFDPPSNPGSTVILHVQPDGIWRIDYQLQDGEDPEAALQEANVIARLQAQLDMMGIGAPWRLIWKSLYRAHCLTLDDYVHGRILFAGDAAHLVPIFGVRGLNSGIDDAHNLGWKLAMVARGEAPRSLLDSYTRERLGAARENHANATKSTWFMSPPGPGFRLMRDAVLSLAAAHPSLSPLINPRQSSAHVYADSPVVMHDAAEGGVAPGAPLPNLPVAWRAADDAWRRGYLHDALPRDFALLVFVDRLAPPQAAVLLDGIARARLPLEAVLVGSEKALDATPGAALRRVRDDGAELAERLAAKRFAAILVRPDEHVAARLPAADLAAVEAALDVALGKVVADGDAAPAAIADAAPADDRERVFEAISRAVEAAGVEDKPFLARLALLLAEEIGDAERVLPLVAAASRGADKEGAS